MNDDVTDLELLTSLFDHEVSSLWCFNPMCFCSQNMHLGVDESLKL